MNFFVVVVLGILVPLGAGALLGYIAVENYLVDFRFLQTRRQLACVHLSACGGVIWRAPPADVDPRQRQRDGMMWHSDCPLRENLIFLVDVVQTLQVFDLQVHSHIKTTNSRGALTVQQ